ncbi:MAG: protein phosphatase 2C domain-containing protein [Beutenbergiaceae bacterium]
MSKETEWGSPDSLICAECGTFAVAGSRFCENCGTALHEPPADPVVAATVADPAPVIAPCVQCGGAVAADGYCTQCGAAAESERDHFVLDANPDLGGVCNRGVKHHRNEDALALDQVGALAFLVVCDGVSSAPASDIASMAAVEAALRELTTRVPGGVDEIDGSATDRTKAWAAQLVSAAEQANAAVLQVQTEEAGDSPSCTYVAAVVDQTRVVVASVGDSRAYWLPDDEPAQQLTRDDSWAQEMIELGHSASQVASSPQAHAITRWLGADAPELTPRTDTTVFNGPGWLLLCSDGLWNYCSNASDLATLVRSTAAELGTQASAAEVAGGLVSWANAQGGRDNVTVGLWRHSVREPAHS